MPGLDSLRDRANGMDERVRGKPDFSDASLREVPGIVLRSAWHGILGLLFVVGYVLKRSVGTLRSLFGGIGSAGMWVAKQANGTVANAERTWQYATLDRMLPPSIVDLIQWGIETTPEALGIRNVKPWQMITGATTVAGVAFVSAFFTGPIGIAAYVTAAVLFMIGVARLVPAINERWNAATSMLPIKDDYNVPRWSRD